MLVRRLYRSQSKPRFWNIKPGHVAHNASRLGLPVPVCLWAMWEGGGNKVYNLSGQGNDGLLTNGPIWVGSAVKVDGNDDYINCGHIKEMSSASQFTWSVWIRPGALSDWDGICQIYADGNNRTTLQLSGATQGGNNDITMAMATGGDTAAVWTTSNLIIVGELCHVMVVFNGDLNGNMNRAKIYVDGHNMTADSLGTIPTSTPAYDTTRLFELARDVHAAGRYLDAAIDNVTVWEQALTHAQMASLYADPYGLVRQPRRLWAVPIAGGEVKPLANFIVSPKAFAFTMKPKRFNFVMKSRTFNFTVS